MHGVNTTASIHNLAYLEELDSRYQRNPEAVPEVWRSYFAAGHDNGNGAVHLGPSFRPRSLFNPPPETAAEVGGVAPKALSASLSDRLNQLIRNYRVRGHRLAALDPLGTVRQPPPELALEYYSFTRSELDSVVRCSALAVDQPLTVQEIFQLLRDTYCRSLGVQFMHLDDPVARHWLQRRMEASRNRLALSREDQLRILLRLTDAVVFEEFLRKKFIGAKTFSLEGSETLLPLLDLAIEKSSRQGVRDIVMGMAHRGRLNVLAHIVGKDPAEIFREFADTDPELWIGRGDVRYHLGCTGEWVAADGAKVQLSLCFNPSHLEFINPVVMGRVRARQERFGDRQRRQVLGVLIHGDAAFAGEGIVQETLSLSNLPGYTVGGTLHVLINNQIGFTTLPDEARSSEYATDVGRMLQAPIFHVNGEDPEAVAQVVELALDFRAEFQTDVFIDMYGYRRWGHNETDEPSFTQPLLYRAIESRPGVRDSYLAHLQSLPETPGAAAAGPAKGVSREEADEAERRCREHLQEQLNAVSRTAPSPPSEREGVWHGYKGGAEPREEPDTRVETERLAALLVQLTNLPPDFQLHPRLERMMEARREMAEGKRPLDWAAAEALAFASLATEGVRIRLAGQDTARGTFSQRHAVLHDQAVGYRYQPLQHLQPDQAPVEVLNSPLSEAGALGFEYGYSLECPDGLVLWEAQFGDFADAAQVIIDEFVAGAEDKWQQLSGLVLLLPHGFEGMGPQHSSARIERFLQLAAEDNLQLVQPTTPAQYFHCLRRQALWKWRKPLVILTPKSLLRHPQAVSTLAELAEGSFHRVLPDAARPATPRRVLVCSGKVYYELTAHRQEHHHDDVAVVRLEQLYPFHRDLLEEVLHSFPDDAQVLWVQEEPENMGARPYLHARLGDELRASVPLRVVCRPESASPATGSAGAHKLEQARLIRSAFGEDQAADANVEPDAATPILQEVGT